MGLYRLFILSHCRNPVMYLVPQSNSQTRWLDCSCGEQTIKMAIQAALAKSLPIGLWSSAGSVCCMIGATAELMGYFGVVVDCNELTGELKIDFPRNRFDRRSTC